MAVFATNQIEEIVQVNDLTRFEFGVVKTPDEGTTDLIEVEPDTGVGFFDITTNTNRAGRYFLDYAYATDGVKTITLRVTIATVPITYGFSINAITAENDKLFSSDADLIVKEPEIMGFLRSGRYTYLDKHRDSQKIILDWLDRQRIYGKDGERLVADDIQNIEEIRTWSTYLTLENIYKGLKNETGDVFDDKAQQYSLEVSAESMRKAIRIHQDIDGDGTKEEIEKKNIDTLTTFLVRR